MEPHDENQTNQDIGFENNIDHLRKEHYKSINNVEKVIKSNNSMGEMNESKNIEHVINEHDKQLADARDALNSIADMQRKFAELIPVEELVANNNNNNNNNNENGNNLYNDVGDDNYASDISHQQDSNYNNNMNFEDDFSFGDKQTKNNKNTNTNRYDYITPQRPSSTTPSATAYDAPRFKYEHFNNSHRRLVKNSYKPTPAVCNNDDDLRSIYAQMCFARPSTKRQIKIHFSDTVFFDDRIGNPSIWYATSRSGLYRVANENVTVKGILQRLKYHLLLQYLKH